jgi:hypothetical protein
MLGSVREARSVALRAGGLLIYGRLAFYEGDVPDGAFVS